MKFRRQHPVGDCIVDFACLNPKLVIELDGGQHNEESHRNKDAMRTQFLEQQGFQILRFRNNEMMDNAEGVLHMICAAIGNSGDSNGPHPNPPPAGEGASPLYLSIAAGKTLAYFASHLGDVPVIRAMPNTPALIRKGISALYANAHVSEAQKGLATELLAAAGETVWLDNESQMDAVTALSGSGPAYVFLFLEALIAAGVQHGLPEAAARKLALQTMRGSVKLALKSEDSLAHLRKNVTSPGGTTEAALGVLMQNDALASLVGNAVAAAVQRSRELA